MLNEKYHVDKSPFYIFRCSADLYAKLERLNCKGNERRNKQEENFQVKLILKSRRNNDTIKQMEGD